MTGSPTSRCDDPAEGLAPLLAPGVRFASCYAYSPSAEGPGCAQARVLCAHLKQADPRWLARLIAQVWMQQMPGGRLAGLFGSDLVLIPVPGSRPGHGGPWVGERLAWCLEAMGLARGVAPLLYRRTAVRKSAFAPSGERPSVLEHYRSFAVKPTRADGGLRDAPRLLLVDDVITRGRTVLAAAARLREAFPGSALGVFALVRTLRAGEIPRANPDPCQGWVCWSGSDAHRSP